MTTTPDNSAQHTTSQPSQPNVSQHLPNNPGVPNLTPCMTGQQVTDLLHARYTAKKYNPNLRVSDEDFAAIIDAGRLSPAAWALNPGTSSILKTATSSTTCCPTCGEALAK